MCNPFVAWQVLLQSNATVGDNDCRQRQYQQGWPYVTPISSVKAIRSGLSVYWRFSTEVTQYSMYNTASLWTHYIKVRISREKKTPQEQVYNFFLSAFRSSIDLYRQVFFNLKQDKSRLYEKRPDWFQDQEDKHQWKPRVDIPSKNISRSIYLAENAWK